MKKLTELVDESVDDMMKEKKIIVDKNTKNFKEMKLVIAAYFEKYDEELKSVLG